MPFISPDEFTSPILKKIASGDELVFLDVAPDTFNITERKSGRRWSPLSVACNNGHINTVNRLLEIPGVAANAAAENNDALRCAAQNGHISVVNRLLEMPGVVANAAAYNNCSLICAAQNGYNDVVSRLLEIPGVVANAAACDNFALRCAAEYGHISVVNRLLEIPGVVANAAAENNCALRYAAQNSHNEVAYVLAKLQWPRGLVDMPVDVHACLPAICQGELMASGKKEAEWMVKCWVRGKPTGSARDIHYPRHDQVSHEMATRTPSVIFTNIMQHAGYRDVAEEAEDESMVEYGMNILLYSTRLHKTFQTAYEKGQKDSKKRAGYGESAMVVYTPANHNKLGV